MSCDRCSNDIWTRCPVCDHTKKAERHKAARTAPNDLFGSDGPAPGSWSLKGLEGHTYTYTVDRSVVGRAFSLWGA